MKQETIFSLYFQQLILMWSPTHCTSVCLSIYRLSYKDFPHGMRVITVEAEGRNVNTDAQN